MWKRDPELLRRKIREQIKRGDFNFEGYHIPETDFPKLMGTRDFKQAVKFDNAHFHGNISFNGAKFSGPAGFCEAEFLGHAGFLSAQFSGDVMLDRARLSGHAWFQGAKFLGDAWFRNTEFAKEANFIHAEFSGDVWFNNAKFCAGAWFRETEFSRTANFDNAKFYGETHFIEVNFSEYAGFNGAEFSGNVWFSDTKFTGHAGFLRAEFSKETRFGEARFFGYAQFNDAEFFDSAGFIGAEFSKEAWFDDAKFSNEVSFKGAKFSREASFKNARFSGDVEFNNAQFSGIVDFVKATFYGNLSLTGIDINYVLFDFSFSVFYRELFVDEIQWSRKSCRLKIEETNLERAIRNYHLLKKVFKVMGHYRLAGDLFYNEMACRRKLLNANIFKKVHPHLFNHIRYVLGIPPLKYIVNLSFIERIWDIQTVRNAFNRVIREDVRDLDYTPKRSFWEEFAEWLWMQIFYFTCGFGERPSRVMGLSLAMILFFGLAYHLLIPISILDAMYLSCDCFVALGVFEGGRIPFYCRWLAYLETGLGVVTISLFLIVFTRKMARD